MALVNDRSLEDEWKLHYEAILRLVWGGTFCRIVGRGGCSPLAAGRLRVFCGSFLDVIYASTLTLDPAGYGVHAAGVKRDVAT